MKNINNKENLYNLICNDNTEIYVIVKRFIKAIYAKYNHYNVSRAEAHPVFKEVIKNLPEPPVTSINKIYTAANRALEIELDIFDPAEDL